MIDAEEFFGRGHLALFHGSREVVARPAFGRSNAHNDYGRGFYCTESPQLASEWACPTLEDGYVNEYLLQTQGLALIDLSSAEYSVLNWIAVLLEHRTFELRPGAMAEARQFMVEAYSVNLEGADLVHGYRADDSYFAFARAFLDNRIGVRGLEKALFKGGLGYQIVLRSQKAFEHIAFQQSTLAEGQVWNPLRVARDSRARAAWEALEVESLYDRDDVRVIDLMRGAPWDA